MPPTAHSQLQQPLLHPPPTRTRSKDRDGRTAAGVGASKRPRKGLPVLEQKRQRKHKQKHGRWCLGCRRDCARWIWGHR